VGQVVAAEMVSEANFVEAEFYGLLNILDGFSVCVSAVGGMNMVIDEHVIPSHL
jgi:hypothetical protein